MLFLGNSLTGCHLTYTSGGKSIDELREVGATHPNSGWISLVRNYLEWLIDLPWKKATDENIDILYARNVLDRDHYGMEKVKKRILEYLAVCKRTGNSEGNILCLVGPPGVGKTSIAVSLAEAMGKKYVRMSLGGVRDEAEIRGHRRTYVGAIPGRIIYALSVAVVAPLVEEFAMRGVVMQPLKKYGRWFAIIASSLVFGVLHGNFIQAPFALIAGIGIGYAVCVTDSIWTGVLIHFCNNR